MRFFVAALLVVSTVTDVTSSTFNGTSSDLAQQFYKRNQAGDSADRLAFTNADIPEPIQKRLSAFSLKFGSLNGLLQRALIWDSGYVLGPASQLVKVYTKPGKSMADLAIPKSDFTLAGCTYENCSDSFGQTSQRSKLCQGTQMLTLANCMSEDFAGEDQHLSMWATGGDDSDVPEPNFIRHEWQEDATSPVYIVLSIHMVPHNKQPHWGECAMVDAKSSYAAAMVIPCGVYSKPESAGKKENWSEPVQSELVNDWLASFANTAKPEDLIGGGGETNSSDTKQPCESSTSSAADTQQLEMVGIGISTLISLIVVMILGYYD